MSISSPYGFSAYAPMTLAFSVAQGSGSGVNVSTTSDGTAVQCRRATLIRSGTGSGTGITLTGASGYNQYFNDGYYFYWPSPYSLLQLRQRHRAGQNAPVTISGGSQYFNVGPARAACTSSVAGLADRCRLPATISPSSVTGT